MSKTHLSLLHGKSMTKLMGRFNRPTKISHWCATKQSSEVNVDTMWIHQPWTSIQLRNIQSAKNKVISQLSLIHIPLCSHLCPILSGGYFMISHDISGGSTWFIHLYTWFHCLPSHLPFHHQLPSDPSGESKAPPPPRFRAALRIEASRLKPPEEAPGPSPGWPWLTPKDEFEVRGSHCFGDITW